MTVTEQRCQDGDWRKSLTLGGVEDGEVDSEHLHVEFGSAAEDNLAQDDGLPERLLGVIVGRWLAVDLEESEEARIVAFGIEQAQTEAFGLGMRDGLGTEDMQLLVESWDAASGVPEGDFAGIALAAELAGVGKELADDVAKGDGDGVFRAGGRECDQSGKVSGVF